MASLTTKVIGADTEENRRLALEDALASVRIEGLEPPFEFHELAARFVAGELDRDEFLRSAEHPPRVVARR